MPDAPSVDGLRCILVYLPNVLKTWKNCEVLQQKAGLEGVGCVLGDFLFFERALLWPRQRAHNVRPYGWAARHGALLRLKMFRVTDVPPVGSWPSTHINMHSRAASPLAAAEALHNYPNHIT